MTPNEHTQIAAIQVQNEALAQARVTLPKPEDVTAIATGILIAAIELLNPRLTDRDRLVRLILGENE